MENSKESPDSKESNSFFCSICSINLLGWSNYQKHVNSVEHAISVQKNSPVMKEFSNNAASPKGALECKLCDKQFNGEAPYRDHMISAAHKKKVALKSVLITGNVPQMGTGEGHHQTPALYECKLCEKRFNGDAPYRDHIVSAVHKKKVALQPVLTTGNASKMELEEVHHQTPALYECKPCQKRFSGPQNHQQHLVSELHKKKVGILSAEFCEKDEGSSQQPLDLLSSISRECKVCNKSFSGYIPYQQHLDSVAHKKLTMSPNSLKGPLRCIPCDKPFSGPENYKQHMVSEKHKKKIMMLGILDSFSSKSSDMKSANDTPDSTKSSDIMSDIDSPDGAGCSDHRISPACKKELFSQENQMSPSSSEVSNDSILETNEDFKVINMYTNKLWLCHTCDVTCSSPQHLDQHFNGQSHKKLYQRKQIEKTLAQAAVLNSQLHSPSSRSCTSPPSNLKGIDIKKTDYPIENEDSSDNDDYIVYESEDSLFDIDVVEPDTSGIAVFEANSEIVLDHSLKKRKLDFVPDKNEILGM